jgi:hypothetical protein
MALLSIGGVSEFCCKSVYSSFDLKYSTLMHLRVLFADLR